MRIIIKNPSEEVTLELRKLLRDIDSAPASWNEINHINVDLKHSYFVTYTCNPVYYEYEYILNIDTVGKLHQVIAWYTVGMSFEDIKHSLENLT
jgi:hypothetical protein